MYKTARHRPLCTDEHHREQTPEYTPGDKVILRLQREEVFDRSGRRVPKVHCLTQRHRQDLKTDKQTR